MNWISIEDKLPENDINIIVYGSRTHWRHKGKPKIVCEARHIDDGCFIKGLNVGMEVTHWMPLPEPPQERD